MKYLVYLLPFLVVFSCAKDDEMMAPPPTIPTKILHISHTRSDTAGKVHDILKGIDFGKFDVLCLGGDLDLHTSQSDSIMDIWNAIFPFERNTTLWSIGNHDVSSRERISLYTGRPTYFSFSKDNVTYLVLDTQLDASNMTGDQLDLIQTVTDSISESNSLVVLSHKLFWMPGHEVLEAQIDDIANGPFDFCGYCTQPNNFYEAVYPLLVAVKERGIQVLCIAGDIGFKTQEFEYLSAEGIHFLASGIDSREEEVKTLLLQPSKEGDTLKWKYELLVNL